MRSSDRESRRSGAGGRPPSMPPDQQIGRLRLIIACLSAVIVGLIIALFAGGGDGETTTVTETVGTEATATTPTTPTTDTTADTSEQTDSGGVSPETGGDTGGEEIPEAGGDAGEVLPEPDLGEDTTEPSGGISPEG